MESEQLTIFVKINDDEPEPYEIDPDSTIEILIAMIASLKNIPPEDLTICNGDEVLDTQTVINSLPLGNILYLRAIVGKNKDYFIDDMFDIAEQKKIEEEIRKQQVEHNLQYAYENTPEAFISFSLLWIKVEINGTAQTALVDTGAQTSILPLDVAKKCSVDYLIDSRFASIHQGIGIQKSLGRIHALNVKVNGQVWTNPFTVMESAIDHMILGIDWMTKNRAIIDLQQRCLILGGNKIPFIPKE